MKYLGGQFAFWTVLGVFFAVQSVLSYASQGRAATWTVPLLYQLGYWYTWGMMAPFITWLVRRNPLEGRHRTRSLFRLGGATLVIAPLQYSLASTIRAATLYAISVIDAERFEALISQIKSQVLTASFDSALTYWMIAGVLYAFHYYRRLQERELRTSQLEASLAEAKLHNLRAQIRPHFLFNTLNSISALVTEDPPAAEKMIAQLSSLLRMAQDGDHKQTVSLREEMSFVGHYLEIEQTRFHDRLSIRVEYDGELAGVQIPPLLLQPIAENAVVHGIAPFETAGSVAVTARKLNGLLELKVTDSGPGFDPDLALHRLGVGLTNTRSRLEQLFGDRSTMSFFRLPEGGFEVRMTLPFEGEE